jgi:hypothetical protein
MTTRTTIDGYDVEVEHSYNDSEGFHPSQCWIHKGRFHGSLEQLLGEGFLYDARGEPHSVPMGTIGKIENFAVQNGY